MDRASGNRDEKEKACREQLVIGKRRGGEGKAKQTDGQTDRPGPPSELPVPQDSPKAFEARFRHVFNLSLGAS